MAEPSQSVRDFIQDSYQIISANSPTVPLHGNDLSKGIQFLNELMQSYSSSGLLITVPQQVSFPVSENQGFITFGDATYTPTPDVTVGRLANLENAWVLLDGITYPLINESRHDFFSTYKYEPLQGLPRFIIVQPQVNLTLVQIFPAPSQSYTLYVYGKFQLSVFNSNADMSLLPQYYIRYLRLALARDLAMYKARMSAWTTDLNAMFIEAEQNMTAASSQNMDIEVNTESWLNGSWRCRSGI